LLLIINNIQVKKRWGLPFYPAMHTACL